MFIYLFIYFCVAINEVYRKLFATPKKKPLCTLPSCREIQWVFTFIDHINFLSMLKCFFSHTAFHSFPIKSPDNCWNGNDMGTYHQDDSYFWNFLSSWQWPRNFLWALQLLKNFLWELQWLRNFLLFGFSLFSNVF